MYSLKIQKGRYRGKSIHCPLPVRGISNSTPSMFKEAVFQILEVRLGSEKKDWVFFDLCAGSGQMAYEALSQDYGEVHICELDRDRFSNILKEVKSYNFPIILHRKDFIRMNTLISQKEKSVLYIDLPYTYWKDGKCDSISKFLEALESALQKISTEGKKSSGLICIQGRSEFIPDEHLKYVTKLMYRTYGNNSLTLLEFAVK